MPEVVIVGTDGKEHIFPDGFDPKRAAAIVKGGAVSPSITPVHLRGGDTVNGEDTGEPDTWAGGFFQSIKDQGKQALQHIVPALDIAAHPKTVGDLGNLAIPEMGAGLSATAHTAAGPLETSGRILESVGRSRPARMLERYGPLEAIYKGDPAGIAASIAPSAARGGGRILQKAGQSLRKPPAVPKLLEESSAPASSLEEQMMGMAESPKSVDNYTPVDIPQEAPPDIPTDEMSQRQQWNTPDDAESILANETQPLGRPRVKEWKEGHGPSPELAGQLRDELGSKDAARQLAITPGEVQDLAPRMNPRSLPTAAQDRMEQALAGMTPEEKLTYLESAPNDLAKLFIQTRMGQ